MRFLLWLISVVFLLAGFGGVFGSAHAADASKPHDHQGIAPKFVGKPAAQSLTAAEHEALLRGEAVQKQIRYDTGGRGVCVQYVRADRAEIMSIVSDFKRFPEWVEQMKVARIYGRRGSDVYAEFLLSSFGVDVRYYIRHTVMEADGYLTWELDYNRLSDLDDSVGYWLALPVEGHPELTRLEYSVDLRMKGWVPAVIENVIAKKGLTLATAWVKRAAEE